MLTQKEFNNKLGTLRKSTAAVREAVQELLVTASYYAYKDGNATPFKDLLAAVGDGTRKAGICAWAETFAPMRVVKNELVLCKKSFAESDIKSEEAFAQFLAETGADKVMWYETVEKEKTPSIFDPSGYLANVFKKLNKEGLPDLADHLAEAVKSYNLQVAMEEVTAGE